jgi:DNA-binding MltR family transcriptional regulator
MLALGFNMARKVFTLEELKADFDKVQEAFAGQSPIACALIGSAYIDKLLGALLRQFFIDQKREVEEQLFNEGQLLENAGAQNKIAYFCGLIPKSLFESINRIQKIRNRFAHSHMAIDFSEETIGNWCRCLAFSGDENADSKFRERHKGDPRFLFMFAVGMAAAILHVVSEPDRTRHREVGEYWTQIARETGAMFLEDPKPDKDKLSDFC